MLATVPLMSSGAPANAHSENCVRDWASVASAAPLYTPLLDVREMSRQGSFQPPGPAYCASLPSARMSRFVRTAGQPVTF